MRPNLNPFVTFFQIFVKRHKILKILNPQKKSFSNTNIVNFIHKELSKLTGQNYPQKLFSFKFQQKLTVIQKNYSALQCF